MPSWREDFLHQLADTGGTEGATFARLADIAARTGFEYCSFGLRQPGLDGPVDEAWWTTYPEAWQRYYIGHDFLESDPVIQAALRSHLPVIWRDDNFRGPGQFWETARQHGVRHGWTLALHGANGKMALVSLARSQTPIDDAELAFKEAQLLWLSHAALEVLAHRTENRQAAGACTDLTLREREILRWTLAGKTSEETGTILGISPRTVNFHVGEVLRKLNVVNKTQAVAKALVLNLIN